MKNIKNLRYYATTFLLAGLISLCGCSTEKQEESKSDILVGYPITIEESKEEINEEKVEVKEESFYPIDYTFITYKDGRVFYTDERPSDYLSVSVYDLVNYFGYKFDYDEDLEIINNKQLSDLLKDLNQKIISLSNNTFKDKEYISLDDLTFTTFQSFDNNKLTLKTVFIDDIYTSVKNNDNEKHDFIKRYSDVLIKEDNKYYISKLAYILINDSIAYEIDLNKETAYNISESDIIAYTNNILSDFKINNKDGKISNNKLLFDPNNKQTIYDIFNGHTISEQEEIAKEYIALNKNYLDEQTIYLIVESYLNSYSVLSLDEITEKCISDYKLNERQLSYIANDGLKSGIEKTIKYLNDKSKKIDITNTKIDKSITYLLLAYNSKYYYEYNNSDIENKIKSNILNDYLYLDEDYCYKIEKELNNDISNCLEVSDIINKKRLYKYLISNYNDLDNKVYLSFKDSNINNKDIILNK